MNRELVTEQTVSLEVGPARLRRVLLRDIRQTDGAEG